MKTLNPKRILLVVPATCALVLASCAPLAELTIDPFEDSALQRDLNRYPDEIPEHSLNFWEDRAGNGSLAVTIDLSEQTAYLRRGSQLVGRSRVATGRAGHRTPTGSFSIMEKDRDKRSNLYGRILDRSGRVVVYDADTRSDSVPSGGRFVGASMPYWMRLTSSGIGMHAGPIPNPGSPASHGCIRMPRHMARHLFINAPVGTPVTIVP